MIIVFRADANENIGTGHVARSLALAESMQQAGFEIHLSYSDCHESLLEKWARLGASIYKVDYIPGFLKDAKQLSEYASKINANWVVIDGHHFGDTYQSILNEGPFKFASIDDYGHCQNNLADILINQNANASIEMYPSRKPSCKLLLGPQYSILRKEFQFSKFQNKKVKLPPENVIITTGGSDPQNASVQILRGILATNIPWMLNVRVITGPLNPNFEILKRIANEQKSHRVMVYDQVDDMASHMRWADAAISGAGITLPELLQQGVPTVTLSLVQNQNRNAIAYAKRYRASAFFGPISEFEPESFASFFEAWIQDSDQIRRLSKRGLETVDGKGAPRVIEYIQSLSH
ncbi:MAG: UDP-2,4-diacetamido-2,4,6-trideoxy-beta-L-altropyranose hydrolase [Verrucomicrobiota bacterium]